MSVFPQITQTTVNPDYYVKQDVSFHEYKMHIFAYNISLNTTIFNVPKVIEYNSVERTMTMEKIYSDNISNVYGEELDKVPPVIIKKIRKAIGFLRDNGFIYPDITGYNFILDKKKIWMIDFEHSYFDGFENRKDEFITLFVNGQPKWNPNFL
jgi:tRNA A-37 threonylcarbamoyl transferase component Bud32